MNRITQVAFIDELQKIAGIGDLARRGAALVRKGWNASGGWSIAEKGAPKSWRNWVPGGKSLTLATTALTVPGAVKKEDPTGQGRSRAERISGLVGGTVGGLAGGAANGWKGGFGGLAGGIGGELAAGRAARVVSNRLSAKRRPVAEQMQPQQAQVPSTGQF